MRKVWMIGLGLLLVCFVALGIFLIFALVSGPAVVEGGVLCKTNNASGRQVVLLAITNHSSKPVSLTVLMGRLENGGLSQDIWILPGPIALNGKAALDLDVEVPWQAIPMPPDATPVSWGVQLVWHRQLSRFESVVANRVEKMGFKYPFRPSSQYTFDLGQ